MERLMWVCNVYGPPRYENVEVGTPRNLKWQLREPLCVNLFSLAFLTLVFFKGIFSCKELFTPTQLSVEFLTSKEPFQDELCNFKIFSRHSSNFLECLDVGNLIENGISMNNSLHLILLRIPFLEQLAEQSFLHRLLLTFCSTRGQQKMF